MSDMVALRARVIGAAVAHVVECTIPVFERRVHASPTFQALRAAFLLHSSEEAGPHSRDALVDAAIARALDEGTADDFPVSSLARLQAVVAEYLAAGPVVVEQSAGEPLDQRITRADVSAGRVASHVIENGVIAPAAGRVNTLTLAEHQARIASIGKRPLTREEAVALGHPADEIAEWFGDAAVGSSGIVS